MLTFLKSKALPFSLFANALLVAAVALLTWRLVDARSDIKEEIGRCNADKLESVLEAERVTNELQRTAEQAERAVLVAEIRKERRAREFTEAAVDTAETELQEALDAIARMSSKEPSDCGNDRPDADLWRVLQSEDR